MQRYVPDKINVFSKGLYIRTLAKTKSANNKPSMHIIETPIIFFIAYIHNYKFVHIGIWISAKIKRQSPFCNSRQDVSKRAVFHRLTTKALIQTTQFSFKEK